MLERTVERLQECLDDADIVGKGRLLGDVRVVLRRVVTVRNDLLRISYWSGLGPEKEAFD